MNLRELNNAVKNDSTLLLNKLGVLFDAKFPKSYTNIFNLGTGLGVELKQFKANPAKRFYSITGEDLNTSEDALRNQQIVNEIIYELNDKLIRTINDAAKVVGYWFKSVPMHLTKLDHYVSILESIEQLNMTIYNKTYRYLPNYYIISPDVFLILKTTGLIDDSKADITLNGPYLCGHLHGRIPVYCSSLLQHKIIGGVRDITDLWSAVMIGRKSSLVQKSKKPNDYLSSVLDFAVVNEDLLAAIEII